MSKFDTILQKIQETQLQPPAGAATQQGQQNNPADMTAAIAAVAKQFNVDPKALGDFISQQQKKQTTTTPAAPQQNTVTAPQQPKV